MHGKVWDEIIHTFAYFNGAAVKILEKNKLFHFILDDGCNYLSMTALN